MNYDAQRTDQIPASRDLSGGTNLSPPTIARHLGRVTPDEPRETQSKGRDEGPKHSMRIEAGNNGHELKEPAGNTSTVRWGWIGCSIHCQYGCYNGNRYASANRPLGD